MWPAKKITTHDWIRTIVTIVTMVSILLTMGMKWQETTGAVVHLEKKIDRINEDGCGPVQEFKTELAVFNANMKNQNKQLAVLAKQLEKLGEKLYEKK